MIFGYSRVSKGDEQSNKLQLLQQVDTSSVNKFPISIYLPKYLNTVRSVTPST